MTQSIKQNYRHLSCQWPALINYLQSSSFQNENVSRAGMVW